MSERRKFWMVWCPTGRAPTVQHRTKHLAQQEAERLARNNPDQRFIVLESIGEAFAPKPVQWAEHEEVLPF